MNSYTDKNEASTRIEIDKKLEVVGWIVQDKKQLNLHAGLGMAAREMDVDFSPANSKFTLRWLGRLSLTYEASNHETRFCDWHDHYTRSRMGKSNDSKLKISERLKQSFLQSAFGWSL